MKYFPGGMAGCENDCVAFKNSSIRSFCANDPFVFHHQVIHFFVEPKFSTRAQDLFPYCCNNMWQFIGSNVWMRLVKYIFFSPKINKQIQNAVYIASFSTPGI